MAVFVLIHRDLAILMITSQQCASRTLSDCAGVSFARISKVERFFFVVVPARRISSGGLWFSGCALVVFFVFVELVKERAVWKTLDPDARAITSQCR
jgi:hypothetical protein